MCVSNEKELTFIYNEADRLAAILWLLIEEVERHETCRIMPSFLFFFSLWFEKKTLAKKAMKWEPRRNKIVTVLCEWKTTYTSHETSQAWSSSHSFLPILIRCLLCYGSCFVLFFFSHSSFFLFLSLLFIYALLSKPRLNNSGPIIFLLYFRIIRTQWAASTIIAVSMMYWLFTTKIIMRIVLPVKKKTSYRIMTVHQSPANTTFSIPRKCFPLNANSTHHVV